MSVSMEEYSCVAANQLYDSPVIGVRFKNPILNDAGLVLVASGTPLTIATLAGLRRRQVAELYVHREDCETVGLEEVAPKTQIETSIPGITVHRINFVRGLILPASNDLVRYVQQKIKEPPSGAGKEKRRFQRLAVCKPVYVMPLSENMETDGAAFEGVVRDISSGGIALFHDRLFQHKFMMVELGREANSKRIQMAVEVLRCRPMNRFCEVAGRFVARIDDCLG